MWLARALPGQCGADTLPQPVTASTTACQVKVFPARSWAAGLGSARQGQRGCASTVVGRCQQGCAASPAGQPHVGCDVGQQVLPAGHGSTLQQPHTGQVVQLLHVQQAAPRLTASLDLQAETQQLHQLQQQQASPADKLHWLRSNRHTVQLSQEDRAQQVQHCFLADPLQLQQHCQQQHHTPHGNMQLEQPVSQGLQQQPEPQPPPQAAGQQHLGQPGAAPGMLQQQQQQQQQQPQPQPQQRQQQEAVRLQSSQQAVPQSLDRSDEQRQSHQQPGQERRSKQQQQQQRAQSQRLQQHSLQPQQARRQQGQLRGQPQSSVLEPPQITAWIKQQHSLLGLKDLYAKHSSSFNVINLSAFLVQLARLPHSTMPPDSAAAVQQLAVEAAVQMAPRLGECHNARQAANVTWALAVLGCEACQELLQAVAQQLCAQGGRLVGASQPQELANLAWGLAKLQHDPTCSLWRQLAAAAQQQLAGFKPGELAMLLWALADTHQRLQQSQKQHWQQHYQQRQAQRQQQRESQEQQQQLPQAWQQQQPPSTSGSTGFVQRSYQPRRAQQALNDSLLSQQQVARQRSHAEASTSAPRSRPSYSSSRRGGMNSSSGSSSSGGKGSMSRKLPLPIRPAARAPHVLAATAGQDSTDAASSTGSCSRSSSSNSSVNTPHHQKQADLVQQLQQLFPVCADVIVQQLQAGRQQYGPKECAMLLRACAVLGLGHEHSLLSALACRQQQHFAAGRCNSQDLANSIWALGKLEVPQAQLLAAATERTAWLQHCSWQELSLVMYGSAAALRQLRQAGSSELLPAAALWQMAAAEALGRPVQGLGVAEAATLLQAAALVLEPVRMSAHTLRQQRQEQQAQQRQEQQAQQWPENSSSSSLRQDSNGSTGSSSGADGACGASGFSSSNSMCSMTCSWDSLDEVVAAAPAQARQLVAVVDAVLSQQASAEQAAAAPLLRQHVAAALHSLAVAGASPSSAVKQLLLSAAATAAPQMDKQELAMTAWAAAKLFGGRRSSGECQQLIEAVDRAAGPLLYGMSPQQLSMLAWAHGRLWELGDTLFMHQLAQAAQQQMHQFGPQALANMMWAFAHLRHYDAGLTVAVGRRVRAVLGQFSPAELANLTWALVTLRHRHAGLLKAIASRAAGTCSSWDAKACVKVAAAFCSKGMPTHRYRSLLAALADALVDKPARAWVRLTPHELTQLAVALAVGRVRQRAITAHVAAVALAWLPRISLNDCVSLVWALAVLGHPHDSLLQAVSTRVAVELQAVGSWKQGSPQHQEQPQQQQQQQVPSVGAGPDSQPAAVWPTALQPPHSHSQPPAGPEVAAGEPGGAGMQDSSIAFALGSPLSTVPVCAVVGSRLKWHHLARLAWAYRTFGQADADWYLAAGQLLIRPPDNSRSNLHSSPPGSGRAMGCPPVQLREPSSSSSSSTWPRRPTGTSMPQQAPGHGCRSSAVAASPSTGSAGGAAGLQGLQRPIFVGARVQSQSQE